MKKAIVSIIVVTLCLALALCVYQGVKQDLNSEDRSSTIQMKINIHEAADYLQDSNKAVIDSLYAMQSMDEEMSLIYFKEALALVKDVKMIVDDSISSPNSISKELRELEENFEETVILLSRLSELSEEEIYDLVNLIADGTSKHTLLINYLYSFSFLYEIRAFDQLPDDEAQSNLKDSWWMFGFNDDIQCPETIDVQELYLIWAKQYFGEFDEDNFLKELQVLRKNDDLSSPECNQRWIEFIENFILTNRSDHSS